VIAWAMIISGIAMIFGVRIPLLGQGLINGVWIILIGWFLNNAASQGYQQMVIRDVLEDVPVSRITKRDPPVVPSDISVESLVEDYIMQSDDHAFPVKKGDLLVGIVCLDDVRRVPSGQRTSKLVSDIMTPRQDLITVSPDDSAQKALEEISKNDIRQLIVLEDDHLFGMVRRRDIVRFLQLQSNELSSQNNPKARP
jgi:CBS domain-containing protein